MDINKKERVPVKKWSHDETVNILEYLIGIIQQDLELEKPTAKIFYNKVLKDLNFKNTTDIQLKCKMKLLRKQYSMALEWEKNAGQDLEEGYVKDHLLKICPHYDWLELIYGNKTNINPPFVRKFGCYLSTTTSPTKKKKKKSMDVFSDILKQQTLAMEAKNRIDEKRNEFEAKYKREEISISKEKFNFEKEIRLKEIELKKAQQELDRQLKFKECETRQNIEKMKIEERIRIEQIRLEYNYKLELAKCKEN